MREESSSLGDGVHGHALSGNSGKYTGYV